MKINQIPVLYLFENVFFPDTIIPMILSDDPSKLLVTESFQQGQPLALYSTHPKSRNVATVGRILMIDIKDDGKLMAIIQGYDRVLLGEVAQHLPYPIYNCTQYLDQNETHILKSGSIERLFDIFEHWMNRHVTNQQERDIFLKEINTPKKLIFNISLFMIKDVELKIMFLESTSIADRINILDVLLAGEMPDSEDKDMAEAIKNFDRLEPNNYKIVAN